MNLSQESNDRPARPGTRKRYSKPRVQIYGTLRDITLMVGNQGNDDGGTTGSAKKTHT